jgi:hypothetical protein
MRRAIQHLAMRALHYVGKIPSNIKFCYLPCNCLDGIEASVHVYIHNTVPDVNI